MRTNDKRCNALDKNWCMEKVFVLSMIGAGGERTLMDHFRKLLPSEDESKDLEDAAACLQGLLSSPLYMFAGLPVQGLISSGAQLVRQLERGDVPIIPKSLARFLLEVYGRLCYFCEVEVEEVEGVGKGKRPTM